MKLGDRSQGVQQALAHWTSMGLSALTNGKPQVVTESRYSQEKHPSSGKRDAQGSVPFNRLGPSMDFELSFPECESK